MKISSASKIEMLSTKGRMITTYNTSESNFKIDLSEQKDGLCFIKITNDGQVITNQTLKASK